LVHTTDELPDFLTVQQEFAGAAGIVVEKLGGGLVGRNVDIVEMNLTIPNQGKSVPEIGFAFSDGLYFGPDEGDARFVGFQDFILEPRLTVVGDDFEAIASGRGFLGRVLFRVHVVYFSPKGFSPANFIALQTIRSLDLPKTLCLDC
jgi:hypothetical protein